MLSTTRFRLAQCRAVRKSAAPFTCTARTLIALQDKDRAAMDRLGVNPLLVQKFGEWMRSPDRRSNAELQSAEVVQAEYVFLSDELQPLKLDVSEAGTRPRPGRVVIGRESFPESPRRERAWVLCLSDEQGRAE